MAVNMGFVDNKKVVQRFFESVLNKRDLSVLADFISENYFEHGPTPGQSGGIDGVRRHIEVFFTAFSDTEYHLEDILAEGNKVVAGLTLTGTHTGDFLDMPPTHARIETSGIDIYCLEGGKNQRTLARNGHAETDDGIESEVDNTKKSIFCLNGSGKAVTSLDFLALW